MSLRRRLEQLEASSHPAAGGSTPPYLSLYLKRMENARRELDGLEPLPLAPEEEAEDRDPEFDLWWSDFLAAHDEEGRPRASPEEYREIEDRWHEMRLRKHGVPRRAR